MPIATSTAIAVDSAATSTDERRSDPARLRVASRASTPKRRRTMEAVAIDNPETSAGIASAEDPINRTAER